MPILAVGLAVTAGCGQRQDEADRAGRAADVETSGPPAARQTAGPAAGLANDPEIGHAMRCWGLTSGSYFLHLASPETAGDLPKASTEDYAAWANQGAVLIKARGGTLADYNALKKAHQTNLVRAREREAAVQPLRTCIATVPREMLEVEQPILTSDD
ncbi:hypothetical protein ACO2Q1_02165 [Brevundimonas sp. VNH65]|uniref:hypothetical protein n=1 Tax=Brevundimonas sp. VNH65 TaxID=3400917 RepID=UPI003BFEE347